MATQVRLLGSPALWHQNGWSQLPFRKSSALLYYLAYQDSWVSRDELLYLFYPELPEHSARTNLRQLLATVRHLAYVKDLTIEKKRLFWHTKTDVQLLKQARALNHNREVVQLYQGELMAGFRLPEAPEYESWLTLERQELERSWREAALRLSELLEREGRFAEVADQFEQLHHADPWDELVLRHYVRNLALSGRREKALNVLEGFGKTLLHEFDMAAEPSTLELALLIRSNSLKPSHPIAFGSVLSLSSQAVVKHNFVPSPTAFVGRRAEKEKLTTLLSDPNCHLITVLGPGGVGKTRLALEVAKAQLEHFTDGVFHIDCLVASSPEFLPSAIAKALKFSFYGGEDVKGQLLRYLQSKTLLLVLDNFEALLDGLEFVVELLSVPKLKVLVTSRERLNLQAEWVYDLRGLHYHKDTNNQAQTSDAVLMFEHCARRLIAGFVLDASKLAQVVKLCQQVQGMPLALELAASWLRVLDLEMIVEELARSLDLLTSNAADLSERHHSIRSILDASWLRLSATEQSALVKLSVFEASFTREAAWGVAELSLPLLLSLMNKSFLRREASGFFSQHPLLRQYGQEKAETNLVALKTVRTQHSHYYLNFVQARELELAGGSRQIEVLNEIDAVLPNIRSAWHWAAQQQNEALLSSALRGLWAYYGSRELLKEGEQLFAGATDYLHGDSLLLADLMGYRSAFSYGLGDLNACWQLSETSVAMSARLNTVPNGAAVINRAFFEVYKGRPDKAIGLFQEAVALGQQQQNFATLTWALLFLAEADVALRQFEEAEAHFREALAIAKKTQERYLLAASLGHYGGLLIDLGRDKEGQPLLERCLEISHEIQLKRFTAFGNLKLGEMKTRQQHFAEAEAHFNQSLAIVKLLKLPPQRLGEVHEFNCLLSLAKLMQTQNRYKAALKYLLKAFDIAHYYNAHTLTLESLISFAKTLSCLAEPRKAYTLVCFCLAQAEFEPDKKAFAEQLMLELKVQLSKDSLLEAAQQGHALHYDQLETQLRQWQAQLN